MAGAGRAWSRARYLASGWGRWRIGNLSETRHGASCCTSAARRTQSPFWKPQPRLPLPPGFPAAHGSQLHRVGCPLAGQGRTLAGVEGPGATLRPLPLARLPSASVVPPSEPEASPTPHSISSDTPSPGRSPPCPCSSRRSLPARPFFFFFRSTGRSRNCSRPFRRLARPPARQVCQPLLLAPAGPKS